MNTGATVATGLAGALAAARRRIIRRFEAAGATGPGTTIAYVPERRLERKAFETFLRHRVLIEAGPERYWFDRVAYSAFRQSIFNRMAAAAGAALAIAGIGIALSR